MFLRIQAAEPHRGRYGNRYDAFLRGKALARYYTHEARRKYRMNDISSALEDAYRAESNFAPHGKQPDEDWIDEDFLCLAEVKLLRLEIEEDMPPAERIRLADSAISTLPESSNDRIDRLFRAIAYRHRAIAVEDMADSTTARDDWIRARDLFDSCFSEANASATDGIWMQSLLGRAECRSHIRLIDTLQVDSEDLKIIALLREQCGDLEWTPPADYFPYPRVQKNNAAGLGFYFMGMLYRRAGRNQNANDALMKVIRFFPYLKCCQTEAEREILIRLISGQKE
jgi:hypothetical protein